MVFTMGELFCGAGGLALGAKKARVSTDKHGDFSIQHAWANDIDEWACVSYAHNILDGDNTRIINLPVQELNIEKLPSIDAFVFGFPCNDYSIVGEQKGLDGDYGPLYTYGVKVLDHHEPLWFVAENVTGLQSANSGMAFEKILNDFAQAGR
ncbi:MAG: DNA (cytosine-5-)-methyltransferase, partial [Clostridiales bacterium]|nr:DNA (cytosine-5-)-methyltransferase [Clostridiales bacterium]